MSDQADFEQRLKSAKEGDVIAVDNGILRTFETGATRDTSSDKLDYEAFLSPAVLLRYAEYMHTCRKQSDGTMRDGDNWQKGIPTDQYMKSKMRHVMDTWLHHRGLGHKAVIKDLEACLCAELFNTMGMLHEILKQKDQMKEKAGDYVVPETGPNKLDL